MLFDALPGFMQPALRLIAKSPLPSHIRKPAALPLAQHANSLRRLSMRVSSLKFLVAALTVAACPLLFADYTYQETTQLTGGSLLHMMKMMGHFSSEARKAGDPVVYTVYLKDNRMAKVNPDTIEIIDLDKETITNIDV